MRGIMEGNKVSIGEFLNIAGVKLNTVKKNAEKIPGLKYENGDFDILSGTRYPGDFQRYKLENSADRRYVLLKAISEYKYIDSTKLKVYPEQFKSFLKELLDAGLISENGLSNHYGANAYDCTKLGDDVLKLGKKSEIIDRITELISSATGHFMGAVISEIYG
jgi:hypothetical protein